MGDKFRSEIQKPVKNPLLSGAGHGFPFETFQGSSLLVPVSQDSPSVLYDDIGEPDKFVGQDSPGVDTTVEPLTQSASAVFSDSKKVTEPVNQSTSPGQGYSGLFSSFFGGVQKQEDPFAQPKVSDQQSVSSISSTPRSYSPYVHVPNIQSFSPVLQVPTGTFTPSQSPGDGLVDSSTSPSSQAPLVYHSSHFSDVPSSQSEEFISLTNASATVDFKPFPSQSIPQTTEVNFSDPIGSKSVLDASVPNHPPTNLAPETRTDIHQQPPFSEGLANQAQTPFYTPASTTSPANQPPVAPPPTSQAPPTFYNPLLRSSQFSPAGVNAQTTSPTAPPPLYNPTLGTSQFVPAGIKAQTSPPTAPPPLYNPTLGNFATPGSAQTPPPQAPSAPPTSAGATSRNYRLGQQKRLAYAPVPGLTSHAAPAGPSLFQPSEPISSPPSIFNPAPAPDNQPFQGNTSQTSFSSPSTDSSVSNYFNSSAPPNSTSNLSQSSLISPVSSINLNPSPVSSSTGNYFTSVSPPTNQSPIFPTTIEASITPSIFNPSPYTTQSANFPPPQQTVSQPSLYTPSSETSRSQVSASASQPSLFSPISNASFTPSSLDSPSVAVLNPVPLHPSTSAPIMSTSEQIPFPPPQAASSRLPSPPIVPPSLDKLAILGHSGMVYRPAYHHWFLKKAVDSKKCWHPFSMTDSLALEHAFNSADLTNETLVATDGGRYDVNIVQRSRHAVYWKEEPEEVRRCSWFYRGDTESRYRPYDENTAYMLEGEYKTAVTTSSWRKKIELNNKEYIIMNGPNSIFHHSNALPLSPHSWDAAPDLAQTTQARPRVVKRGVLDDIEIEDGEPPKVDHLVFVVHGIGSVCDLKMRTIEEAVNYFRGVSHQLMKTHFRSSAEQGYISRVEFLPVSWHYNLHSETTGVDKKLKTITLKSIPRLRNFTNDTLLDVLFYTSPVYCQNIVQQVGHEINTLFEKFKSRNPGFYGGVSLAGHSLGSLILFDMLCHQKPPTPASENSKEASPCPSPTSTPNDEQLPTVPGESSKRRLSRNVSYVMGTAGTGQPFITYPQLNFQPTAFFALGSPIGMFVTIRGIDSLGLDFRLPTCPGFFNIFHPFDPVAYRIEALISPDLADKRPVLIPHHKGRKRMHLELKETMARVSADLKQRLVDSVRSTWNTVYQLTMFGRADDSLEQEVGKVIEKQLERQSSDSVGSSVTDYEDLEFNAGCVNQGRRLDYVLQEAPLESFNEYVSAITSHAIYWASEDTMLLILKEIYGTMGVSPDSHYNAPHGLPEDFSSPPPTTPTVGFNSPFSQPIGMDPTVPMSEQTNIKPPPMTGFVKK